MKIGVDLTREEFDKLYPVGTLWPIYSEVGSEPHGRWRVCDGRDGMPNLRTCIDGKIIDQFKMRVE